MQLLTFLCTLLIEALVVSALQFNVNPTSDVSADSEKNVTINKTMEFSEESGHEADLDVDVDDVRDKKFMKDAMKTILDPTTVIGKPIDTADIYKYQLHEMDDEKLSLKDFMDGMNNLSLAICRTSQEALWEYVTEITNEAKKNRMIAIVAAEDEIKKQYWDIIKKRYINDIQNVTDHDMKRKLRVIKERGTNVQMPQSKQREEIDVMQSVWSSVAICPYKSTDCPVTYKGTKNMGDVITVFKTSNNTKELLYYWKAYRDATGRRVRPIFKDYVKRMNTVAQSENFTDAGDMWRYTFEDDNFIETVSKLWDEVKPLYFLLHGYVRQKLKKFYAQDIKKSQDIPAHLLGNLWAQEWQTLFPKIAPFPDFIRPPLLPNETISSKELFDNVDDFHQSLGFESSYYAYQDIQESMQTPNCLPSSHDMCDGNHYKIKWCGEKITDVADGLSRAARLLGHVQYFKHYRHLSPLYRDGPNPAFHDAISDIIAVQVTSPNYLKSLNLLKVDVNEEVMLNHLLWLALEKFPLMAYAYVLDKWRWDVFSDASLDNWNDYWWDLRTKETGISPPIARDPADLDPASKYHVVSHVQYITYLISHILEFQILLSLCNKANYTGPLHECTIYGSVDAGTLLSKGMSLGASEDWRTVLKTMTNQTELSTEGLLKYFEPLREFLTSENLIMDQNSDKDMDATAPIIVGIIVILLTLIIIILYCLKRYNVGGKMLSVCGLSKNGSLDIVTRDMSPPKISEVEGICEDKV